MLRPTALHGGSEKLPVLGWLLVTCTYSLSYVLFGDLYLVSIIVSAAGASRREAVTKGGDFSAVLSSIGQSQKPN